MKRKYLLEATVRTVVECSSDMLEEMKQGFQDMPIGAALALNDEIKTIKLGVVDEYQKQL